MKKALRHVKNSFKNVDIPLLVVTTTLIVFGLIMVFSSSSVTSVLSYKKTPYYFFVIRLSTNYESSLLFGTYIVYGFTSDYNGE